MSSSLSVVQKPTPIASSSELPPSSTASSAGNNVAKLDRKPSGSDSGNVNCARGIAFKDVWCVLEIGKCGGGVCSTLLPNDGCCLSRIRDEKKSSRSTEAPCPLSQVASSKNVASRFDMGFEKGDVCFPNECGTCGGEGYGKRVPGGACCIENIHADKRLWASLSPWLSNHRRLHDLYV